MFTALELLEHVTADVDLLERIPSGRKVVFSVPSYMSAGHVRKFKSVDAVCSRYERCLAFDNVGVLHLKKSRAIFVVAGTRL